MIISNPYIGGFFFLVGMCASHLSLTYYFVIGLNILGVANMLQLALGTLMTHFL